MESNVIDLNPTVAQTSWDLSEPMKVLGNQPERWTDFGAEGLGFIEAADLIMQAAKEDGEREDFGISSLKSYAFGPRPDGVASLATAKIPGRENRLIPLRAHAFGQLCSRLGAPAKYIRALPAKLQIACINYAMQNGDDNAGNLVRLANGEARALLSQGDRGYAVLDNGMVLETLEKALVAHGMLGDVRVRSIAVGRTCSIRMTFPEHGMVIQNPTKIGDVVEVGLDLLNGEIGNRSVSVTPMTYRLVCLNGMRSADRDTATRLRHVGDPARLVEAFQDAVPAALAAGNGLAEKMQVSVDRLIDDVLGEFDGLRAFGLSMGESRDVARDVMAERQVALPTDTSEWTNAVEGIGDVSAYDVLNGITHVAQGKDVDRRIDMEEAASRYLRRRTA